jgi:hypothetical protein
MVQKMRNAQLVKKDDFLNKSAILTVARSKVLQRHLSGNSELSLFRRPRHIGEL